MAEYIKEGEMVEGKKCAVSARRMEFKKGGLRKIQLLTKIWFCMNWIVIAVLK